MNLGYTSRWSPEEDREEGRKEEEGRGQDKEEKAHCLWNADSNIPTIAV